MEEEKTHQKRKWERKNWGKMGGKKVRRWSEEDHEIADVSKWIVSQGPLTKESMKWNF